MDQSCQRAGVQLMQRLIAEYPDEWTQVVSAHELLGNYYRSQGQVAEAEREYRKVLEFYRRSRSCTSGLCDLSLVELILESNQAHKYSEAWQLLQSIPQHLGSFGFNSDRFRYRVAAARLAMRVGNTENAKAHAREALELAQITKPQFSRHPAIGLVKAEPAVLSEMQTILSR
jgi:tetratricopeptide (TPR) repeat protein